ncbi:MAG: DNRLRE domain-containing protein [Chitinophagaceae bacterium]
MMRNSFLGVLLLFSFVITACQKDPDVNNVPVVDAGTLNAITLPKDSVILKGTASDLDGKVVAYLWSQVSGPAVAVIANPGTDSTIARGLKEGKYVFQLMATDNLGATGVDTVSLVVNPNPIRTLTLQPAGNPGEKMLIKLGTQDQSSAGAGNEVLLDAWTVGDPHYGRCMLKFDLSSIPASATIQEAHLLLYSNTPPESVNKVDANYGADNSFYVQQITADWNASTVAWATQPAVTTTNQVTVPSSSKSSEDIDINVSTLVASMVSTSKNYGFLLKLKNEVAYTCRVFVGSNHPTKTDKYPKLVITYK